MIHWRTVFSELDLNPTLPMTFTSTTQSISTPHETLNQRLQVCGRQWIPKSCLITIHLPSLRWKSLMFPRTGATTTQITTSGHASRRASQGKLVAKLNGTTLASTIFSLVLPSNSSGAKVARRYYRHYCQEPGAFLCTFYLRRRKGAHKEKWVLEALQV